MRAPLAEVATLNPAKPVSWLRKCAQAQLEVALHSVVECGIRSTQLFAAALVAMQRRTPRVMFLCVNVDVRTL
jgi:hypothetical protein